MPEHVEHQLSKISELIQSRQFEQALFLINNAPEPLKETSHFHVLKGILHSQLREKTKADLAFEHAIALDPENSIACFNYATHLYQEKEMKQSLSMLERVLKLNPEHTAAIELHKQITNLLEQNTPVQLESTKDKEEAKPLKSSMARSSQNQSNQCSPILEKFGGKWIRIGLGVALVALILYIVTRSTINPEIARLQSQGLSPEEIRKNLQGFMQSHRIFYTVVLVSSLFIRFVVITWLTIDIIGRGAKWTWVIPFALPVSLCLQGIDWMVIPLYIFLFRKRIPLQDSSALDKKYKQ